MYSGVFGVTRARATEIFLGFLNEEPMLVEAKVLHLDEEKYSAGVWAVRFFHSVLTAFEPIFTQVMAVATLSKLARHAAIKGRQRRCPSNPD